MKNKKILELCLSPGLGGLELFVSHCYSHFSQKSECFVAVAPQSKLDKYLEGVAKFYVKRSKFFPFVPALALAKYIDRNDIDIVHFHWNKDSITAVLAKVLSKKKPKLVQSRHMGMTRFKDDIFHRWIYKNIDMIHAVTKEVKSQLEKFIPSAVRPKIEVIYLGVSKQCIDSAMVEELRRKHQIADDFVVGIVGRIEKGKGQYKLIEALHMLKEKKIKLFIVGAAMEASYLEDLKKRVVELGLQEKVIFTGFTKNVAEYMQLFDVNVLATEHETFGLVIIEAMLQGIPVIATAKGGPLEIIDDGVDGFLFDGSSKDLKDKILLLLKNEELRELVVDNAYSKVKRIYNQKQQLEKLLLFINS